MTRVLRRAARAQRRRAAIGLGVLTAIAIGCAPTWAHIRSAVEGGDNTVTPITTDPAPGGTWSPGSHQTRDYSGHTITDTRSGGADGTSRFGLTISGSGTQNGLYGLRIAYDDASTNWDDWHYRSGLKLEQNQFVADQVLIRNEGDAFKPKANDVRISRSWVDGSHDDCVQADYGHDGITLEDDLFDQCYSGISARPSSSIDASKSTMLVERMLLMVSDKTSCYKPSSYGCPTHAGWLKWDTSTNGMRLSLTDATFAAASYPEIGSLALNAPVTRCDNVTLDYMGAMTGSDFTDWQTDRQTWIDRCPGVTVHEGPAALTDYQAKVDAWHQRNPTVR